MDQPAWAAARARLCGGRTFTPDGHVGLHTGRGSQDGADVAVLRVTDPGVGIPADELPRLPERFFRGQGSADVAGSGIGLTIVAGQSCFTRAPSRQHGMCTTAGFTARVHGYGERAERRRGCRPPDRGNRTLLGIGPLGRRLIVAFVGVTLAALAVNAAITAESLNSDISTVMAKERTGFTRSLALASAHAYRGPRWRQADLMPVMGIARLAGAGIRLTGPSGRPVGVSQRFWALPAANSRSTTVISQGRQVGRITVRFSPASLRAIAHPLEARRARARLISAAIAAVLALIVSIGVARAITGPLERLLEAVRARGAGGRSIRIDKISGVGVVRELLESFNHATDALDNQDRLQRDLVANVAHELRTPVAVLMAGHEAMLDGVTALSSENVESLRDETVRLGQMIDGLQRLAAAESASLRLRLARHDLADIAAEAAAGQRNAFAAAGLGFTQWLTPAVVTCDRDRIRDIISNLLANALKYTEPGGKVVLESGPAAGGGGWIKVTDSGIGIPGDELPHVTERLYRGVASPGIAAGTGIGLAIVAEFARAHGGEVDIASEPGRGTEVTVTLPDRPEMSGR